MRSTPVLRFSAAHSPPAARRGAGLSPLRRFFPRLAPYFFGPPVLRICTVRRVGPIRKLHAYTRSIQTMVLRFFSAVLPSFFFAFAYASVPGPREKTRLCPVAAREWPFYPQSTRKDKGRVEVPLSCDSTTLPLFRTIMNGRVMLSSSAFLFCTLVFSHLVMRRRMISFTPSVHR